MAQITPSCSLLTVLRGFILAVTILGVCSIICSLIFLQFTTPVLRLFIVVVGIILLMVSATAWKMTTADLTTRPRHVNSVFLRAYRAELFDNDLTSCATRHPAFIPFPFAASTTISIPRPSIVDPFGPPTMLAPPPPPTYQQSEETLSRQQIDTQSSLQSAARSVDPMPTTTAPPVYSVCDALRRTSTHSPPPLYVGCQETQLAGRIPEGESEVSIIDCRKAEPTTFHYNTSDCSTI